MKFNKFISSALLLICAAATNAPVSADEKAIETVKSVLEERFPRVEVTSVSPSPAPGWIEVIAGTQVIYVDESGKYMMYGSLVEIDGSRNLTEQAMSNVRLKAMEKIDETEMVVYRPEKVEHTVTIVTDIDCPYCRKLHSEMDEYIENNIKVQYLLMPLKGRVSYQKSLSVWCSDDKNLALDIAKAGGSLDQESCEHPLAKHESVSRALGIRGTPAILLEDGTLLPGYVPIKDLIEKIEAI